MGKYLIYKNLAWLNDLSATEAEQVFTTISESPAWARGMVEQRPFPMLGSLFEAAATVWSRLPPREWAAVLEGLSVNGKTDDFATSEEAILYRERFGFIFLLYSSDPTDNNKRAACRQRLRNSPTVELRIAADEYRRSIEQRLEELLEK